MSDPPENLELNKSVTADQAFGFACVFQGLQGQGSAGHANFTCQVPDPDDPADQKVLRV